MRPKRKDDIGDGPPWAHAQRIDLEFEGGKLVLWEVGDGPTILALHGWEGAVEDLKAFVPDLVRLGLRVVALELPAHGRSDGEMTSLFQCVRAVNHAVDLHIGKVDAILAHSFGCAVGVEAIAAGLEPEAVVLLATPARYIDYAEQFGRAVGLDHTGIQLMLNELRELGVDVGAINTPDVVRSLNIPALIIHSDNDRVIPSGIGQEVANSWPGAKFMIVSELGHRKILSAPNVVRSTLSFLKDRVLKFPLMPEWETR